jgi:hypothetical protein
LLLPETKFKHESFPSRVSKSFFLAIDLYH